MGILSLKDVFWGPFIMVIILIFGFFYKNKKYRKLPIAKYFIPALLLRFLGTIVIASVYQFYYGYGDTFGYFLGGQKTFELFFLDTPMAIDFIFSSVEDVTYEFRNLLQSRLAYSPTSLVVIKIVALLSFFSGGSYVGIATLMGFYGFMGVWYLYMTFYKLYPSYYKELALAVLFIPSVVIWGTGIFKDTICIGAVGFITYAVFNIFIQKKHIIKFSLVLIFNALLLFSLKDYILIMLAPALMLWVFLYARKSIKNKNVRKIIGGVFLLIGIAVTGIFVQQISSFSAQYSLDRVLETAEITQTYLESVTKESGGVGYSLGEIEYTPFGLLKTIPKAINVTLFRPYIWEARKVINIPAAIESFIFLIFTLFIFFKVGFIRTFKKIFQNPNVLFCLVFAIPFAAAVGLTSYNYGTLVRYKIPCLPFYLIALIILWKEATEEKDYHRKMRQQLRQRQLQSEGMSN